MMMKMRAPAGATSIVHQGRTYNVKDGYIVVPKDMQALAQTFGYGEAVVMKDAIDGMHEDISTHASALSAEAIAAMGRGQLMGYCEDNRIILNGRPSDKELRETVLAHANGTLQVIKAASE